MKSKRVVVTGMAVVSSLGSELEGFYESLLKGESGVSRIENFPVEDYPCQIAAEIKDLNTDGYIDKKQARRIDPFIRYALLAGKKALEDSLLDLESLDKNKAGILVGSGMGGMGAYSNGVETLLDKGYKRISPFFVPYILTNIAGAMLAIDLGFRGPNYSISTACATANHCMIAAARHICSGEADVMLAGGSEASIIPMGLAGFIACKALSQSDKDPKSVSRPFDKSRDGFVMGEGSAVLVLESLEHAQARGATIYAEYLGGGISCDAYHLTSPLEEGEGQVLAMQMALKDAGMNPKDVNYINAHATSTLVGDIAELRAIKKVFGKQPNLRINATKSITAHLLGAAAAVEAVATIMSIVRSTLHPTINVEDPEDLALELGLVQEKTSYTISAAMSNSFGFGGHNSSVIFSTFEA